jgi:2-succinyl-5-enolpyruvyl-6-hydroxy-3-cyclohexene-1-carboxylate synthase
MHYQPVFDIAELCVRKGLRQVILCPGSRCAPLTLAFTRHSQLTCRTFSDERSAGFIGLGIAQHTNEPAILLCTSGSAAYNFAPAVAEAFFSQTPLIVFTADRPAEWIGQHDGQTIYQSEIFGRHVKRSYQLPQDYSHADSVWAINRIINEAINLSRQEPMGPVHINAPFREPLYPGKEEVTSYSKDIRVIEEQEGAQTLSPSQREVITKQWPMFRKVLVVAGQQDYDAGFSNELAGFCSGGHIPFVADIISNFNDNGVTICHSDLFLGQANEALKRSIQPDLLITFGKSLVSKNLKLFLRKYAPQQHWHIQPGGVAADTFKNLTHAFHASPHEFFKFLATLPRHGGFEDQKQQNFARLWEVEERRAVRTMQEFFPNDQLTELDVVKTVLHRLPKNSILHLANSMSVRYANIIGLLPEQTGVKVYSNRGTSGIDGCTSTALGHALMSSEINLLITGDLAFFYDRNAFWNNYVYPNLRVLLLNNHGGLIFNMIDGPASQPESPEYFITQQKLNASSLCQEFGFDYLKLDNKRKLSNYCKELFEPDGKVKIMEVETDLQLNRTTFDNLKQKIKQSYES